MATLTYTFGPSKNYGSGTDWRRQILIGSLDNLTTIPSGSIKSIELSFVVRNAIPGENPIEVALTKNFNKETAGSWDTTLKENKGYEYQTSGSTSSYYTANRANLFFADEDYLIRTETSINISATGNQSIIINWNIISEGIQDLSKWPTKLYLALLDLDDDDSYYCLWASDKIAQLTIEYDEESEGSVDSTVLGKDSVFTIKPKNSSYKHTVQWKCKTQTETISVEQGITTCSCSIPKSWGNLFPTSMSYSGTDASITLITYTSEGNQVGRPKTYPVTYIVPNYTIYSTISIGPTTHDDSYFNNSVFEDIYDNLYTNKSSFALNISSISQYGETFSYQIRDGQNGPLVRSGMSTSYNLRVENFSSNNIYVTVKDSRGKILNLSGIIEYTAYSSPKINSVTAYRCNTLGIRDDDTGKCAKILVNYNSGTTPIKEIANTTICSITLNGETYEVASEQPVIFGIDNNLSTDKKYSYTITLTDTAGSKVTKDGNINAVSYLLHFRKKDNNSGYLSLGIGCPAPEADNRLDIGWPTNINSGELKAPLLRIRHPSSVYPALAFHTPDSILEDSIPDGYTVEDFSDPSLSVGVINCNILPNSRRIYFEEYPVRKKDGILNDGADGSPRVREQYFLPSPSQELESSKYYQIHTTKNPIALEHGGTGIVATSVDDLKFKLGIVSPTKIIYSPDGTTPEVENGALLLIPIST